MAQKRLYRDTEHQKLFGVCAGLAEYFELDVTLIRVIWILLVIFGGTGILAYIILAIVMEPKSVVLERQAKEKKDVVNDDPFAKYDDK